MTTGIKTSFARPRARRSSGDAVIATDPLGRILYWDEEAAGLYGWSASEAVGRNIVDITPPIGLRAEATQIMRQLRSGESWTGIFEVVDKHDSRFFVEVTDSPVFTEHGKLVGIIGVSRAIGVRASSR